MCIDHNHKLKKMESMSAHPQTVATCAVPVEDPCQTILSIRGMNLCDNEEFNQVRMLIDRVVNEFEVDHLNRFACRIYDYDIELYAHLVRQSPTLVNVCDYTTTLHCAAGYQPWNVPILIELGGSVNGLTDMNETPLDKAYWYQNESAVRFLLKNGASTMIGKREWLANLIGNRSIGARLIQRSYYLSLVVQIKMLLDCHLRSVVEMLA